MAKSAHDGDRQHFYSPSKKTAIAGCRVMSSCHKVFVKWPDRFQGKALGLIEGVERVLGWVSVMQQSHGIYAANAIHKINGIANYKIPGFSRLTCAQAMRNH